MNIASNYFRRTVKLSVIAAAALVTVSAAVSRADTVDLGAAGGFAVIATDQLQFNGPGLINGDVAVGNSVNFAAPAVINGTLFESSALGSGNITPTGGTVVTNLSNVFAAAESAATAASALTATQTFSTLGNNVTITGTSGSNVIDTSSVTLTNGLLTLSGSATSSFVINDTGGFTFSNSGVVLTGGLTAANVLFNVTGDVALTGGGSANFAGIILAPNSQIAVHDKTLTGEIIGKDIQDTSGFTVNGPSKVPLPAPVAACGVLMTLGLAGSVLRKKTAIIA